MADNKKRFEELIGESINPDKKPLYSEDFITDKEALKVINENKTQEEQENKVLNEQKESVENEVSKFLAEKTNKKDAKIISEGVNSSDEIFIIDFSK